MRAVRGVINPKTVGALSVETAKKAETTSEEGGVSPFLKWAGGKRWLVGGIEGLLSDEMGTYFEPFLGSAAMYFSHCHPRAVLSDTNERLIETYAAIKDDYKKVVQALGRHARKHNKDYYYKVRQQKFKNEYTRAAQFIYLNRTCWNGLYRVNLDGVFNVPKGTKDRVLLGDDDFGAIAKKLCAAEIACADFEIQIDRAMESDVVFADPPYTVRHNYNGFVKYNEVLFSWDDQLRLHAALLRAKQRGVRIFLTNANHDSIRALYQADFSIFSVKRYSAISSSSTSRGSYSELLISA